MCANEQWFWACSRWARADPWVIGDRQCKLILAGPKAKVVVEFPMISSLFEYAVPESIMWTELYASSDKLLRACSLCNVCVSRGILHCTITVFGYTILRIVSHKIMPTSRRLSIFIEFPRDKITTTCPLVITYI